MPSPTGGGWLSGAACIWVRPGRRAERKFGIAYRCYRRRRQCLRCCAHAGGEGRGRYDRHALDLAARAAPIGRSAAPIRSVRPGARSWRTAPWQPSTRQAPGSTSASTGGAELEVDHVVLCCWAIARARPRPGSPRLRPSWTRTAISSSTATWRTSCRGLFAVGDGRQPHASLQSRPPSRAARSPAREIQRRLSAR